MLPLILCRFVQTTAAVLLGGTQVLRLLATRTEVDWLAGWNRLAWASVATVVGTSVIQLWLVAADMTGGSLPDAFSTAVLASVLFQTSFGTGWLARLGVLAGLFVALGALGMVARTRLRWVLQIASTLLSAALLANLVWSGHAQASDQRAWLLPVDVLHVIVAGAWPGGLVPLVLLLARARNEPVLVPAAVAITRRFSRLSVVAVGVLVLSGLMNSYGLVGTIWELWPTPYGRLLLVKVTLVAGMVGLGAMNRRLIGLGNGLDPGAALRTLWRNVAWESVLAGGVLLATEALAMNAPPA